MSGKGKHRVAVVGYGNVGRAAAEAVLEAPDMELAGIVRRRNPAPLPGIPAEIPIVTDLAALTAVDVALLCIPSRRVPAEAARCLAAGVNTVDSYDVHGDLVDMRRDLQPIAREYRRVAIISAGWDPGTDSVVRAMLEFMMPEGETFTNFGPGMSMGHTVAARAVPGVADAVSITEPAGRGVHRRRVYVKLEPGADFARVEQQIRQDAYFRNDETTVTQVDSVEPYAGRQHGVRIEREGMSGRTPDQRAGFDMRIMNPAMTGQIMVAAARATMRQQPGAYTMLEVPLLDFLPGDRELLLRRLV